MAAAAEAAVSARCAASTPQRSAALAAFGCASNVYLFVLPLRVVWRLHIDLRR